MKKQDKKKILKLVVFLILVVISIFAGDDLFEEAEGTITTTTKIEELDNIFIESGDVCNSEIENDDNLRVYYFDVGQADSILVVHNNETMLIDAGNNDDGDLVVNNLEKLGIDRIDYLIGTHPHEDHIGGLDDVIDNFEIGTIYMPKVSNNTSTFEDVLDSISNKNLKVTTPSVGHTFEIGDVQCEVMSIKNDPDDFNACSIVLRMEYNEISYLFMGDAEKPNELARDWPQTTILKVGHHGSNTSSCEEFLYQVMPTISIISAGQDNDYGHPHKEVLDRLNEIESNIYVTKDLGNILITQTN